MITLFIEALFALVFAQAVAAYVRRREALERDVMAVFASIAVLFVLELVRRTIGVVPQPVRLATSALLLAHPFLTLRLVHRLRPVPRWLLWSAGVGYAATVLTVVLFPPPLPGLAVLALLVVFVAVELTAAALLVREARARTGSPRARLASAAAATALFGLAILVASAGAADRSAAGAGRAWGQAIALMSAIGYLVAFRPPVWVRRLWSATAAYTVSRRLLDAPATEPPEETWSRYARTVREVSGSDAVLVIPPQTGDERTVVTDGLDNNGVADAADVEQLLRSPRALLVGARRAAIPTLVVDYADQIDARHLAVAPLRSSTGADGVLGLLDRRRSLFAEDDLRLLGELGGQATIIAERGAVRAEQERLAEELARSVRALSAASQAKSDFLANMSHELRTPLNAIIGFSELMRGEQPTEDHRRLVPAEWSEHIYSSGRHLLNLINDILDLAKIEAGRLEMRPEGVELPSLVADAISTLRPLAERKQLQVVTDVPPLEIRADRVRLRQVLDNLLSNAIKFTPDGGRITVRVVQRGGEMRLSVADTGVGIAPADLERVFEEFQQVGDVSMHQAGTGLGLALTKRLVESHGGRIELESEVGVGSRFTVCLPTADAAEAAESATAAGAPGAEPAAAGGEPTPPAVPAPQGMPTPMAEPVPQAGRVPQAEPVRQAEPVPQAVTAGAEAAGSADRPSRPGGIADEPARVNGAERPAQPGGGILLIEDEPSAARLLRTYLESAGHRVRVTSSGEEGLLEARRNRPDVVVLDVLLPGIDGWEVLRLFKQDRYLRDVPIFVASVVDERDVGLSLGAVDFFVKPIDRHRLLARVAEHLLRPGVPAKQMHVLAVDDDPRTLEIITEALRGQQIDVVTASSGQEAVRLARSQPFDLIISDLLMPDIDGISLMSALDDDPATRKIPVLVVTREEAGDGPEATAVSILPRGEAVHAALRRWMTQLPRHTHHSAGTTGPEATQ